MNIQKESKGTLQSQCANFYTCMNHLRHELVGSPGDPDNERCACVVFDILMLIKNIYLYIHVNFFLF
jgi:hypothetical protein